MTTLNESAVEEATLDWFSELGYEMLHCRDVSDVAPVVSYTLWTDWTESEVRVMSWQLQEAKQKFSELVRRAEREGPQVVTRHGEEVVVVVPAEEYRRMIERKNGEKKMDFKEFLMSAPEGLEMIVAERPKDDYPRGVDLTGEDS